MFASGLQYSSLMLSGAAEVAVLDQQNFNPQQGVTRFRLADHLQRSFPVPQSWQQQTVARVPERPWRLMLEAIRQLPPHHRGLWTFLPSGLTGESSVCHRQADRELPSDE